MKDNAPKRKIFDAVDVLVGDSSPQEAEKAAGGVQIRPFHDHPFRLYAEDKMAEMVGVSHGTYDKMKAIDEKATPETKQLVREGKLSINQAFNSVHPKRPVPVKLAKAEHAEFQEKKHEAVVSFKDAQIDKINQTIIENDLYQTVLKLLANVEKFGMQYKTAELEKMFKSLKSDELDDIRNRCVTCKSVILAIQIATTGLHDY